MNERACMAQTSKRIGPVLPGRDQQPGEITCPHCGTFVGAMTRCPSCGAPVHKSMRVRAFRYAALLLATVGLFLLYLMSIHKEIPKISIGDISGTMNFGYVRIRGQIAGPARVYREGDIVTGVRFAVNDGTGVLSVRAYGAKGAALEAAGKIPTAGDTVDLTGSLNVSAEDQVMYIQSSDHVHIQRAPVESARLDEITEEMVGRRIKTAGTVTSISTPNASTKRPYVIAIKDGKTTRDLVVWQSLYDQWDESEEPAPGDMLNVTAEVSEYRGRIQLNVSRISDLERLPGAGKPETEASAPAPSPDANPVTAMPVADITREYLGRKAAVRGRLTDARAIRGGVVYTLTDETGDIETVIWENRVRGTVRDRLEEGAEVWLRGNINEFRDRLQIIPDNADDIHIPSAP